MERLAYILFILTICYCCCSALSNAGLCTVCGCEDLTKTELPLLINCQSVDAKVLLSRLDYVRNFNEIPGILLEIDLSFNQLESVEYFPRAPIVRASFQSNQITRLAAGVLSNMTQLSMLDLSHNNISKDSLDGEMFRTPTKTDRFLPITSLDLSYNQISSLSVSTFWNLPYLDHLSLNGNPLKWIDPMTMGALQLAKRMTSLRLASTGLSSIPDNLFQGSKIQTLDIGYNNFSELPLALQNLANLKDLRVDSNPMEIFNLTSFKGLTSLEILSASNMPSLKLIESGTFQQLGNLSTLILSNNKMMQNLDKDLFGNPDMDTFKLRTFILRNNSLQEILENHFPEWFWTKVEIIDLRDNPWNCNCRIKWFLTFVLPKLNSKTDFANSLVCENPLVLQGSSLLDLYPEKLICQVEKSLEIFNETKSTPALAVGISLMGLAILLIAVVFVVFKDGIRRKWSNSLRRGRRRSSGPLENSVYRNNPTSLPINSDDDDF